MTNARNSFFQKLDVLYGSKISPLEKSFRENPNSALAELVEFLSIDIAAFRTGYAKEFFLKWLKRAELTPSEIGRVQQVAIKMCETNNIRREFRRWCRLMIKHADAEFVLKLKDLSKSEIRFSQLKSRWMLEAIQKHRLDLRDLVNN